MYINKGFLLVGSLVLVGLTAQAHPTTQTVVSRPKTDTSVSRPTTNVSSSRPVTTVKVSRPETKTAAKTRSRFLQFLSQDLCGRFILILPGIQAMVISLRLQQLAVGSLFHNPAVLHHQDQIRVFYGG